MRALGAASALAGLGLANRRCLRCPRPRALRRQLGCGRVLPEPARVKRCLELLAAQVVVTLGRDVVATACAANDRGLEEDHQVRFHARTVVVAEQRTEEWNVAGVRKLLRAVVHRVLYETAEH